jgi:hypothetical protein
MARTLHLERPTRRTREVNWGDRTRISGSEKKTLAWVSLDESGPIIVYASAIVSGPATGAACFVNVEWGHGGASIEQGFPVIHRLRVPLAASMVKVSGELRLANGKTPPATVSADVSVVIAPGTDGETMRRTEWTIDAGPEGVISSGPARALRLEGFNGGAKDVWAMFFDGPATNGEVPIVMRPARRGRTFAIPRFDSQAFRTSLTWAASSTPMLLTKDPTALLRIDAELLL